MDLKLEQILAEGTYCKKDTEFGGHNDDGDIWSISGRKEKEEKVYTYDEAIELTGNGWYNVSLLLILSLAIQGMTLDMFGFSYVVAAAACDLHLSHDQTSFLLSVPLIASIVSAYIHGYVSDTQGRKKCLIGVLWGSFFIASLSALSPNFTVLVVLKFFCSSVCTGIQSLAYTLLGESCSSRTNGAYLLILTSSLLTSFAVFTTHAYLVLGLDFSYDLGFIIFKPWRLLILTLAMTLGFSAVCMSYFYESPKFLVNAGRTEEALEILKKINERNRRGGTYPVKKIILLETTSTQRKDGSFLKSLWNQTAPLFTPPLLQRTLLLFYISFVTYSVNNGFMLWVPVLFRSFFDESSGISENATESFCELINSQDSKRNDCSSVVNLETFLMSIIQGLTFVTINFGLATLAHKKKTLTIVTSVFCCVCCFAMIFATDKITTIVFFFGVQMNVFSMGIFFCYYNELYPTSCRGMISCLGVMVARGGAMIGVYLVGVYTFTSCTISLYVWGAYVFSGALVSLLLPPDSPKKS